MKLKDTISVVTGAATGIGRATAIKFAEHGSTVILADINLDGIKKTSEIIEEKGYSGIPIKIDLTSLSYIKSFTSKVISQFKRIDILVNNAGITRDSMFHKMTLENWKKVLDVNINGTFNCLRAVVPGMRERKSGNIVNISSTSRFGNIGQSNYSTSKAGIAGLTRVLAKELGGKGIRVNAIAPGAIETSMYDKVPEEIKKITREKNCRAIILFAPFIPRHPHSLF